MLFSGFLLSFVPLFFSIDGTIGQQEMRQCFPKESQMAKSPYFIGTGFTCCNNILMEHPIKPKNEHWKTCMGRQHGNDGIATTLWNAYMCELSSASNGGFSAETFTYKKFESFSIKNYPAIIKEKILMKNTDCEVENGTDLKTKFETYEKCFLKTEEDICFNMAGSVPPTSQPKGNGRICEPIESLPPPTNSFQTFAQPCCKGKELPYPLFDIFMDFDRFDVGRQVMTCTEKFKSKLRQLNHPAIKENEPLTMCQVACVHEIDGLGGNYNVDFQELLNFKLKAVSNTTKSELMEIISKYKPKFQMYGDGSAPMPIEQAGNVISKMDEGQKILNYCKFQFEATAEAYRALYEHCFNAEYGNQFRDDILRTTAPRKN